MNLPAAEPADGAAPHPVPAPSGERSRRVTGAAARRVPAGAPEPGSSGAPERPDALATDHAGDLRSVPTEDPAAWCGALVRAAVETLAGTRPAPQLARWLSAELYDSISRRAGLAVRIKGRPARARHAHVRCVRVCRLGPLVAEASVVLHDGARVRAAAIRVEAHRGRWRATALELL